MKRLNLGDILLNMGAIDTLKLRSALAYQKQWGLPLGRALIENRLCSRTLVMTALAQQAGLPVIDLDAQPPLLGASALINLKVAVQHRVVPLRLEGRRQEVLVVAIAAPASLESLDAVRAVSGKTRIVAYLATDEAIQRWIERIYEGSVTADPPATERAGAVPQSELEFEL